jgi:peptidyl-prolyl cis-trans isomerase C
MRWGTAAVAAAIVIAGSGAVGAAEQQPAAAAAAAGAPRAVAADDAAAVARVNGVVLTRGEYERNLAFVLQQGLAPAGDEGETGGEGAAAPTDELRTQVLDRLIDEELLHQEARRRSLLAGTDVIEAEIAQARSQFPTPEGFTAALAQSRLTEEGLRAVLARNLSIQNLVEKGVAAGVAVTDAEVGQFYAANAESFALPEQVQARHILVQFAEDDDAAAKQAKRAKAEGLLAQIKGGAAFEELARTNSDCPSAAEGGDLGFFERGQMVPAFDDAAFALKPGEVSGVVETEYGYHIIKLEARKAAGTISREEAAPQITEYLRAQKTEAAVDTLLKELRAAAKIEKLP